MADILFDGKAHGSYEGKNGWYIARGMTVNKGSEGGAHINVINSKGIAAGFYLLIPKDRIQQVINELQQLV